MSSPAQDSHLAPKSPQSAPALHNDSTDSDSESDQSIEPQPNFTSKMIKLSKEIAMMLAIILTYAALTTESPPKVSKSPAAYPFFPQGSLVKDWYRGQIGEAIQEARAADLAFVMFYAPWDAESQGARGEFQKAALLMQQQVNFAAINCWQPDSECRRQYSKVFKWPVLIAYPTHGRGVQYNGPLDAMHMVSFLRNMATPLFYSRKFLDIISTFDAAINANINVLPGSYDFAVFYTAAMRFLERDPFREVGFVVAPQARAAPRRLAFYVWNETLVYDGEWNVDDLTKWILNRLHQVVAWVSPSGSKSLTLAQYIQPVPALILFTPKNPLVQHNDYYDALREIAYEYNNCNQNAITRAHHALIRTGRLKNRLNYHQIKTKCLTSSIITNTTCPPGPAPSCTCTPPDTFLDHQCFNFYLSQNYSPDKFERSFTGPEFNITGLECATNKSLTIVAMDSLRYFDFGRNLGVDLSDGGTAVVIIDEKGEKHHVMEGPFTGLNVRLFLHNFTRGVLKRSLRSRKPRPAYPLVEAPQGKEFFVRELRGDDFLSVVLEPHRAAVVFYYSKNCAFCSGIAHVFLTVAKILGHVEELQWGRINGDVHLLPWEYTMESYPAILFFPAKRKSESRVFPRSLPITIGNLLGFLVTNSEPVCRLRIMWTICLQAKFPDDRRKCVGAVRSETLAVIGQTLREWRKAEVRRKSQILRKLQVLKSLHLLFAHAPHQVVEIKNGFRKLNGGIIRDEL